MPIDTAALAASLTAIFEDIDPDATAEEKAELISAAIDDAHTDGGGGGGVDSVNGHTGVVVLDHTDVGADEAGAAAAALADAEAYTDAEVTAEAALRASGDATLATAITAESTARSGGDATLAAADAAHVAAPDPHAQYVLEADLGTASLLDASTTPTASGLLQLDAYGWFGMAAVLASWRYAASFASFVNNATSGYGFTISQAGTGGTPSTLAYSNRFATANSGWFVSARLASLTIGFAYALIFKLPTSITSRRLWIGLGSTTMSDSDTAAGSFVGVRYSTVAGDAGFMPASRDGASQTIGAAGSAPVADVPYMMTMVCASAGSSVAVKIIRLDTGATVLDVSITATLPASATALDWLLYCHGQGTSRSVEVSQAVRLLGVT